MVLVLLTVLLPRTAIGIAFQRLSDKYMVTLFGLSFIIAVAADIHAPLASWAVSGPIASGCAVALAWMSRLCGQQKPDQRRRNLH